MTVIEFDCDRCGKHVSGLHHSGYSGGFYDVSEGGGWQEFALSESEHFVCDGCVQEMPLYRERYGESAQSPTIGEHTP